MEERSSGGYVEATLHLAFDSHWGTTPGYFDGDCLLFQPLMDIRVAIPPP